MRYLLDTNICLYLIARRPAHVRHKFNAVPVGDIGISSISVAELQFGVEKSSRPEQAALALEQLLLFLPIADFDAVAAHHYGKLRAMLERNGTPIGPLDMLIAAHALALETTLVTNNVREFQRVLGLAIENWADAESS